MAGLTPLMRLRPSALQRPCEIASRSGPRDLRLPSEPGVFADLAEPGRYRGSELARAVGAQVADETRAGPARLLERDLDALVAALVAVVEHRDDPVDLGALGA